MSAVDELTKEETIKKITNMRLEMYKFASKSVKEGRMSNTQAKEFIKAYLIEKVFPLEELAKEAFPK